MKKLALIFILPAIAICQTFPARVATNSDLFVASDQATSSLSAAIDASTLSISIFSASKFLAFNIITIDSEQIKVCSVSGNILTVCSGGRGFAGTNAVSHNKGVGVFNYVSAIYHNTMSTEVQSIETYLNGQSPVNVKKNFGCLGNGTEDDRPCFDAAFAAGVPLIVPPGNYLIDLSAFVSGWTTSNFGQLLTFMPGAKWVIKPPTLHTVSSMIVFNIWTGAVINNMVIDYQTPQTTPCIITGVDYCSNTLAVINSGTSSGGVGPTFNGLRINNAQAIAAIVSNNYNVTFNDTVVGPSAGTIFNGNENLHINGFSCPATTWDDCLNVTSQSAAVAGTVGAFINGLYSFNSWASGLRIGTPEVSVSGFDIISAQNDGIDIQYASVFSQTDPPARVSLSNGTIRIVRNNGQATSPSAPKCGIYISSDLSGNNIGNISIVNTDIDAPDGAGVCSSVSSALIGTLSIANSHVNSAGNGTDPALEGSCFHILGFTGFSASNNSCDLAKGLAYYVNGSSQGTATITGGSIHNVNALQGSGAAIWMDSLRTFNVGGMTISDDRATALSFQVKDSGTVNRGVFHDLDWYIQQSTVFPGFNNDAAVNAIYNFNPGMALANIGTTSIPASGSQVYCVDCDTPASQGATCSAAGDHAGAQAIVTRGVRKCY